MIRAGLLVLAACAAMGVQVAPERKDTIAGEYLIALHSNITGEAHTAMNDRFSGRKVTIGWFKMIHAKLNAEELEWVVRQDHLVRYVERNAMAYAVDINCPQTQDTMLSWGQVRTTTFSPQDVASSFAKNTEWGKDVDIVVLDTGVRCSHIEFAGGRCQWGANFAGGGDEDRNGHGTHCAGTAGGNNYGIAQGSNIIGVKVLGNWGGGTMAGIINGLEWTANHKQSSGKPTVASMSLGGGTNTALNEAADALVDAGVHTAVAAGNNNGDACNTSPAAAKNVVCVGSTELGNQGGAQVDARSSFSNWGTCVDIFAPGTAITSAGVRSDDAYATQSGTSMACPHVAGALAYYLSHVKPIGTPAESLKYLVDTAVKGGIRNPQEGSPNALLHIQC